MGSEGSPVCPPQFKNSEMTECLKGRENWRYKPEYKSRLVLSWTLHSLDGAIIMAPIFWDFQLLVTSKILLFPKYL